MKILNTERLIVSHISLEDTDFIIRLVNSPNWIKYIGDRAINTSSDAVSYIQTSIISSYDKNGFGLYKMSLSTATPIGICGFVKRDYLDHPDIGFAVLPTYEGKGYAFEAAQAMLTYGITSLHLSTILAITTHENLRSRKLLSKLKLSEIDKILPKKDKEELLLFSNKIG